MHTAALLLSLFAGCASQSIDAATLNNSYERTQRVVYGQLDVFGVTYDSECVCKAKAGQTRDSKHCQGLTPRISPPGSLLPSDFEVLAPKSVSKESFSCMDGRVAERGYSTPGGDAGEFIMALHLYEHSTRLKEPISYLRLKEAFDGYLRYIRAARFIFCSDVRVVRALFRQAGVSLEDS